MTGRRMGLFLLAGALAAAALRAEMVALQSGVKTTLAAGNVYTIPFAEGAYTVTTEAKQVNARIQVRLQAGQTATLTLETCVLTPSGGAALDVAGGGTLVLKLDGKNADDLLPDNTFAVMSGTVDAPAIALSSGAVLRIEGSGSLRLKGRWYSRSEPFAPIACTQDWAAGATTPTVVIAEGTLLMAGSCSNKSPYGVSPLIDVPVLNMTGGELVCEGFQKESGVTYGSSIAWAYPEALMKTSQFRMTGGRIRLPAVQASNWVAYPEALAAEVQTAASGGTVFGKRVFMLDCADTVVPAACFQVKAGAALSEAERTADAEGRVLLDASRTPELVFAAVEDEAACAVFGLLPSPTEKGLTADCDFGIAGVGDTNTLAADEAERLVALELGLRLPERMGIAARSIPIAVFCHWQGAQDSEAVTAQVFPASGSGAEAVSFTYDEARRYHTARVVTAAPLSRGVSGAARFSVQAFSRDE